MSIDEELAIRKITFYYSILSALFLMLSSQFTGFIMPLVFIIPIYMGLMGIKRRRKSGYLIGMSIVPLAFAISVLWIRYSINAFAAGSSQIAKMSEDISISTTTALAITIVFFMLSLVMVIISVIMFVRLRRNKELFT
jgi:hypothetical protein